MKSAFKFVGLLTAFVFLAAFSQAATVTGSVKSPDGSAFRGAFVQAQSDPRVLVSVLGTNILQIERPPGYQVQSRLGVSHRPAPM